MQIWVAFVYVFFAKETCLLPALLSPNDRPIICSDHFTEDCYDLSYDFKTDFGLATQRKKLVKNAVLTINKQMKMITGPLPVCPARYDSQSYRKRKRTEYFEKRERKRRMNGSISQGLNKDIVKYLDSDVITEPSEVFQRYDEMASIYEELVKCDAYKAPSLVAATLGKLFLDNRECVRVLDVAAGTGLCAVEFHKHGFRKMDALDGSKVMLQEAEKKNVYTRLINDYLGENTLDIEDNTYDAVTISGMTTKIMENLPMHALMEVIRITEPGGYFINAGYSSSFNQQHLWWRNTKLLEEQGRWEETALEPITEYSKHHDGILSIHRIC